MPELRRMERVHATGTMAQRFVRTSASGRSNRRASGCTVPALGRVCALFGLLLLQHPVRDGRTAPNIQQQALPYTKNYYLPNLM